MPLTSVHEACRTATNEAVVIELPAEVAPAAATVGQNSQNSSKPPPLDSTLAKPAPKVAAPRQWA